MGRGRTHSNKTPANKNSFICNKKYKLHIAKKSALGWLADISTPQLKSLRILHLEPINVVVSHESTIPNLGVGFVLRCFQRLSLPYIATQQFTWWQS